ncbi:hypothetical protein GY45DRAFT_1323208 [Cubamyces sp. BRFM 1775]|nr:hypothetical protein GY45DRAFT_1323208 [Cubamyces sp. BRFM 1775]
MSVLSSALVPTLPSVRKVLRARSAAVLFARVERLKGLLEPRTCASVHGGMPHSPGLEAICLWGTLASAQWHTDNVQHPPCDAARRSYSEARSTRCEVYSLSSGNLIPLHVLVHFQAFYATRSTGICEHAKLVLLSLRQKGGMCRRVNPQCNRAEGFPRPVVL